MATKYDYIICGAGAAGLSLALRLSENEFSHLKILIIDKEIKSGNDHTWCFWETDNSLYDGILTNSFDYISFHSKKVSKKISISPYRYKMLQSAPFYSYAMDVIENCGHIEFLHDTIININEVLEQVKVSTSKEVYIGRYVFSSMFQGSIDKEKHLYVDQHFKGWFISTEKDAFDSGSATFMDFRIDQDGDARFFYVLPFSRNEALVEIAIFSNEVMSSDDYDPLVKEYIDNFLDISSYKITEKEFGIIPMTSFPFWNHFSSRIFPIGIAGGAVKPSSGFAFKRIQEHCDRIKNAISNGEDIASTYSILKNRFYLYDKILLDVLLRQNIAGESIFGDLFKYNDARNIFKFLDGKTNLVEEAAIFKTLPLFPFLRGWFRQKLGI